MAQNSQNEIFSSVKGSMAKDLSEDMLGWDFQTMLIKLREQINRHKQVGKNSRKVRSFSRHILGLRGDRFNQVRQWLKKTLPMSDSDIRLVLTTLLHLEKGTLSPEVPARIKHVRRASHLSDGASVGSGARRKIVDLIIGTLNNFVGVTAELKLTSEDVLDGDRMQMVSALQNICSAMGIKIQFSRLDEANSMPVKQSEMKQLMKGMQ